MSLVKWIDFSDLGDARGSLIVMDQGNQVPFEIRRLYCIYGTQAGTSRGFHAHKDLRQIAVCVAGKCKMVLDNGKTREEAWFDTPKKGLLIESMVWREMHDFSPDCVLLVLANHLYDEADYIRDYQVFLAQA